MIKLDTKDKKILALLDENARFTNSQIAKKVGLSKPAVEYRIQRLHKNNLIFEYYTVINFAKLGYSLYKIYFKFQNTTPSKEKELTNYWVKQKNAVWVAECRGKSDLAVSILAKNNFEFGFILNNFMNKFSKFVLDKEILLNESTSIYSRSKNNEFLYAKPQRPYELDEAEKRILGELATSARINIIDLAEKLKLSRDIVNYRMKKLTSQNIISQYRCYPMLENLGIKLYKVIIRTKNLNNEKYDELKSYSKKHSSIPQILKLIGSWDLEIEIESESEDEFYKVLNELRKNFSDIIRDFDIIRITDTKKYNYFPF